MQYPFGTVSYVHQLVALVNQLGYNPKMGTTSDAEEPEGFEERFARRVKFEREARNLSQSDLAKLLSKRGFRAHSTTIAKIESRDGARPRTIRLDEAAAIAEIFGTTIDDLLGNPRKFDRQAAVDRVPKVALRTLRSIESAVEQLDQAIDALHVDPEHLNHRADLLEEGLIDDISVGPLEQRAMLMALSRGGLAKTLNAMSETIGGIGRYATMDEDQVEAKFRATAAGTKDSGTIPAADDANPS